MKKLINKHIKILLAIGFMATLVYVPHYTYADESIYNVNFKEYTQYITPVPVAGDEDKYEVVNGVHKYIYKSGENIIVDFKIKQDQGINACQFALEYNPDVIQLVYDEFTRDYIDFVGYTNVRGKRITLLNSDDVFDFALLKPLPGETDCEGADGIKTASELGEVKILNYFDPYSDGTLPESDKKGTILFRAVFKQVGIGDSYIGIKQLPVFGGDMFFDRNSKGIQTVVTPVKISLLDSKDFNSPVYGDVTGDRIVSTDDSTLILNHVLNPQEYPFTEEQLDSAKVYNLNNNDVDANDAAYVLKKAIDVNFKFPVELK